MGIRRQRTEDRGQQRSPYEALRNTGDTQKYIKKGGDGYTEDREQHRSPYEALRNTGRMGRGQNAGWQILV